MAWSQFLLLSVDIFTVFSFLSSYTMFYSKLWPNRKNKEIKTQNKQKNGKEKAEHNWQIQKNSSCFGWVFIRMFLRGQSVIKRKAVKKKQTNKPRKQRKWEPWISETHRALCGSALFTSALLVLQEVTSSQFYLCTKSPKHGGVPEGLTFYQRWVREIRKNPSAGKTNLYR